MGVILGSTRRKVSRNFLHSSKVFSVVLFIGGNAIQDLRESASRWSFLMGMVPHISC